MTDGVSGDRIQLDGMFSSTYSGVQEFDFADGTVWTRSQILANTHIIGASGTTQTLNGTTGNNIFDSQGGKDKEVGKGGFDTYLLAPGYSPITITNGVSTNNTAQGNLRIANENPANIWLRQVGSNLEVDIMGSKTSATMVNWFSNNYSQLSEITVTGGSSGNMTLDSQLSQLIQAMASYSANHTSFNPQSSTNAQITDPTVLSAVSSAWHQTT
jgi:hypothetical protein